MKNIWTNPELLQMNRRYTENLTTRKFDFIEEVNEGYKCKYCGSIFTRLNLIKDHVYNNKCVYPIQTLPIHPDELLIS